MEELMDQNVAIPWFCRSMSGGWWGLHAFCTAVLIGLIGIMLKLAMTRWEDQNGHMKAKETDNEERNREKNNNDIKLETKMKKGENSEAKMDWKEEIKKREGIDNEILELAVTMESEEDAKELITINEKWKVKLISKKASNKENDWKRKVIRDCLLEWKGDMIAEIDFEDAALAVTRVTEEWRANLIKDITKGQQWKIKLIENAISKDCADKIDRNDEKWKCELISQVSIEESWKISLINSCSIDRQAHIIFNMKDEDKADIYASTSTLWKLNLMEKCLEDDPWKLDLLSLCKYYWQGKMVAKCRTEDKANIIALTNTQWKAKMIMDVEDDVETFAGNWKLKLLQNTSEYWRAEMILKENREQVAQMIAKATTKKKAEVLMSLNRTEEWRLKHLDVADSDWKVDLIAKADTEVKALAVNSCRFQGVGELMKDVKEEWKLFNMTKTEEPWRAAVIKMTTEEWQSRLIMYSQSKDMEVWRVSKIPEIKDENIAVQYLFGQRSEKIPVWKFDLCVKLCQKPCDLSTRKVEKMFGSYGEIPRWRATMIAKVEENEAWKVDYLAEIKVQSIAEHVNRCSDEDQARMVANCKGGWQAMLVADCLESWRTGLLSRSDMVQWRANLVAKEKSEWKAAILAQCEEEWRAKLIVNADKEWKVNLLDKSSSKVSYKHKSDEWRYRLIADAETEWKAITIGEVEEQWRAEMIFRIPTDQEWKSNLIAYHGIGREEQWRLKLVENLDIEWQVKMLLLARNCTQVWKAKIIASLGPKDQKRANEILECHTEEFAHQVLNGEFDTLYV